MAKLKSRYGISHAAERAAIKAGVCPSYEETETLIRSEGKAAYKKWQRTSSRQRRVSGKLDDWSDICPN